MIHTNYQMVLVDSFYVFFMIKVTLLLLLFQ